MNNAVTMKIEIIVTRTSGGLPQTSVATVEAKREERGLNPTWLADKIGRMALKKLDENYYEVSKTVVERVEDREILVVNTP